MKRLIPILCVLAGVLLGMNCSAPDGPAYGSAYYDNYASDLKYDLLDTRIDELERKIILVKALSGRLDTINTELLHHEARIVNLEAKERR